MHDFSKFTHLPHLDMLVNKNRNTNTTTTPPLTRTHTHTDCFQRVMAEINSDLVDIKNIRMEVPVYLYIIISLAITDQIDYVKWQWASTNSNWSYAISGVFPRALTRPQVKGRWPVSQLVYSCLSLLLKEDFFFVLWFMILNSIKNSLPKPSARYG